MSKNQVLETYNPDLHRASAQSEPSSFNGRVRVERWKVSIKKILEPPAVIKRRVLELLCSLSRQEGTVNRMRFIKNFIRQEFGQDFLYSDEVSDAIIGILPELTRREELLLEVESLRMLNTCDSFEKLAMTERMQGRDVKIKELLLEIEGLQEESNG